MAEMLINEPAPKTRTVDDYDFVSTRGTVIPLTIDKEAGDTITTEGTLVHVYLAAKPSPVDLDVTLTPEDIVIYTPHLLMMQHRTREIEDLTTAQKFEWKATLQEMSKTVQ